MAAKTRVQLLADIVAAITTNGANEITGAILNQILQDIVDSALITATEDQLQTLAEVLAQGATTGANDIQVTAGQKLSFSNSSFLASILAATLTANRTQTLPDKDGTFAMLSDVTGGGASVSLDWNFATAVPVGADPGVGAFTYNHPTPSVVFEIFVNDSTNSSGVDTSTLLSSLSAGDQIYIQQNSNSANFSLFTVVSSVDNTGWFTITVSSEDVGANPVVGEDCTWIIAFKGGGAPASGFERITDTNDGWRWIGRTPAKTIPLGADAWDATIDDPSIGVYGWHGASGDKSFAAILGIATGVRSIAIGSNVWAEGHSSIAMGNGAHASNSGSIAIGETAIAEVAAAIAFGNTVTSSHNWALITGRASKSGNTDQFAAGLDHDMTIVGYALAAAALGKYSNGNTGVNSRLLQFVVGSGANAGARFNALEVFETDGEVRAPGMPLIPLTLDDQVVVKKHLDDATASEWIRAEEMEPDGSNAYRALTGPLFLPPVEMNVIVLDPIGDSDTWFMLNWEQWMTDAGGDLTFEIYLEADATRIDIGISVLQTTVGSDIASGTNTFGSTATGAATAGELSMITSDVSILTPPAVGTNLHMDMRFLSVPTVAFSDINIFKIRVVPT